MFDIFEELAAIRRQVGRDDTADTVTVTVRRTYRADADDVWEALTTPERLGRWFSPVTGDLKPRGTFHIEGNASGEIMVCDRPAVLQGTFGGPESIVEVRLHEQGAETTVELTHTVPLAMAGSGAGALFVGPGWDGMLLGLSGFLRGDAVGDPVVWANTPEVIEFNKGAISSWTEVVEGSGTATADDIAGAREAAVAQYTTMPSDEAVG